MAAQSASPAYSPYVLPIFPYRGMYYEPGHGGTGLTVDIDNKGYVFAVLYAYTPDGQPYFYLMEGQYRQRTDRERLQSGILGSFEATPYISEHGQCVGEGCDYKSPQRTATDLHAEIVWTTPRTATLTIGGQVWQLRAGEYTVSDADAMVGQWSMVAVVNASLFSVEYSNIGVFGSFSLRKNSGGAKAADFAQVPFLSPDSVVYDLTWLRSPQRVFTTSGTFFALYNPHTGRLDIVQAALTASGSVNPGSVVPQWAVFPDGPQVMRGRREYGRESSDPRDETRFSVESDVTLVRTFPVSTYVDPNGNIER